MWRQKLEWLESITHYTRYQLAFMFLLAFGCLNIISVYGKLSHSFDEAPHVGAGMEWWTQQQYTFEPKHPPLPRIMASSLLYLAGNDHVLEGRIPDKSRYTEMWRQGSDILHADDTYRLNLSLARLPMLTFFILSCFVVHRWAKDLHGELPAICSLALYVTIPMVAAHSAVAMTDMPHAAMLTLGVFSALLWLKTPTLKHALLFGLSVGLMLSTKLSCIAHFPGAMGLIVIANYAAGYLWGSDKRYFSIGAAHFKQLLIILPTAFVITGAFIFYSLETFMIGLRELMSQNKWGHAIWLFEPLNNRGVWYFFPVVYFFKTPLAFLACNIMSAVRSIRYVNITKRNVELLFPILAALGVFISSMPSNINVGLRHALPVYPLLAVSAGYGLLWIWQQKRYTALALKWIMSVFLLMQLGGFAFSYPDRLSYYNIIGMTYTLGKPEYISPDNDVDSGQGFLQLGDVIKARDIKEIYTCFWLGGSIRNMQQTLRVSKSWGCPSAAPENGWLAISRVEKMLQSERYRWLDSYTPVQEVGGTILLYHFP